MAMQLILISACLLGERVRYDGNSKTVLHPYIEQWQRAGRLISICPEVAGGLAVPRAPAEIILSSGQEQVFTQSGIDVTEAFNVGAQRALELAQKYTCEFALLTARSPSCGNDEVYSGEFNGQLIEGAGVTVQLLQQHGIEVFNQNQIEQLHGRLNKRF